MSATRQTMAHKLASSNTNLGPLVVEGPWFCFVTVSIWLCGCGCCYCYCSCCCVALRRVAANACHCHQPRSLKLQWRRQIRRRWGRSEANAKITTANNDESSLSLSLSLSPTLLCAPTHSLVRCSRIWSSRVKMFAPVARLATCTKANATRSPATYRVPKLSLQIHSAL